MSAAFIVAPALAVAGIRLDTLYERMRCQWRGCASLAAYKVGAGVGRRGFWSLCRRHVDRFGYESRASNEPAGKHAYTTSWGWRPKWKAFEERVRTRAPNWFDSLPAKIDLAKAMLDVEAEEGREQLRSAVESLLPEKHKIVICMRFGLYGEPASTLKEVASVLGLTIERVRQIESSALQKLQRHCRVRI